MLDLAHAVPAFPLRTSGRFIVDANGMRVRLKCVNWYGAHLEQLVANGLDQVKPGLIAKAISESGFNCVRLPFSLDGVIGNLSRVPDPKVSLAACPDLQDRTPLEIFDATVDELTKQGLMVILNNHVSSSMWCCSTTDGEGLWHTKKYPEAAWLEALTLMADRYKANPWVIGFDLRNEIRPAEGLWPEWGTNKQPTDWAKAATEAAQRVLEKNENMLIVISGLYFSIFLCQVPAFPLQEVPFLEGRLVYTVHEYEWFNFHLIVRKAIEFYGIFALAAFPVCWLVLCLKRRLGRRLPACPIRCRWNEPEESRDWCHGCRSCSSRACNPCMEFSVAALLATFCAVCLKIAPRFIQRCDIWGVYAAIFCASFMPACALVSICLWTRAVFLVLARREEIRATTVQFELPILPGSSQARAPDETRHQLESQSGGMWKHAKRCQSKGCMLAIVVTVMASALVWLWSECGAYQTFRKELEFRWGFLQSQASNPAPASWLHWKVVFWRWYHRIFRFGSKELEPLDVGGIFEMLMAIHGQQIFIDGCFNADPHPGNILLLEDGHTLGLIDFGQVMYLPQDFRLKLARLILALAERKPEEASRQPGDGAMLAGPSKMSLTKSAVPWASIMPEILPRRPDTRRCEASVGRGISGVLYSCGDVDSIISNIYMRFILWWGSLKEPTRSGCLYDIVESKPFRPLQLNQGLALCVDLLSGPPRDPGKSLRLLVGAAATIRSSL
eukprot:Skav222341  [mRNA]  locus=scaffold3497:25622:33670:- [translate_table: standard]